MKKFYSLCLALSVSGLVAMPLQAAQGEMMSIFTEDFSAFTEGSAEAPAEAELSTTDEKIPVEFTHNIAWYGRGIHQAGGACAIMNYEDYTWGTTRGWIQTPYTDVRLDEGRFTLRFKARVTGGNENDSILLYLYDKYSSNYYERKVAYITDEWQVVEVPFQHSSYGNHLAYVQMNSYNHAWLIDDVEFVQDVYGINVPRPSTPSDVTYEGFTAHWDAVWSATTYLVSVYSYADEAHTQREYLIEDAQTTATEYKVEGTEKGKEYYFTVKACNEKYTSDESDERRVYVPIYSMETPETAEPTDVSETGYTAQWLPVERAMGYAVRHYLRHTALEDEMYNLVHEDLETITDGTLDWPAYFYDENLDKYSKMPGWKVNMGCTITGMIGIDNYFKDYEEGKITSPEFDLARNEGRYSVELKVYAVNAGDIVYVDSYSGESTEHQEYEMTTTGEHSFVVDFANGAEATYFTITFSGTDKMFIDDIIVKQMLKAGESYTSTLQSFELEGYDATSYTFTDLEGGATNEYLYAVAAWSWSFDEDGIWGPTVYSEYSEPRTVRLSSGCDNRLSGVEARVYAADKAIWVETIDRVTVQVYDAGGRLSLQRLLPAGKHRLEMPARGFYIVRVDTQSFKVVL